jgi:hypothetical protein
MNRDESIYRRIDDSFSNDSELGSLYEAYMADAEPLLERDFFVKVPKESDIRKAILGRKYVGMFYAGDDEEEEGGAVLRGFRLIEPYALGKGLVRNGETSHPDRLYLRAFVIKDTSRDEEASKKFKTKRRSVSKSRRVPYWRLFRVDRIRDWQMFDKTFSGYRELYNPDDSNLAEIIASLDQSEFPKGEVKAK